MDHHDAPTNHTATTIFLQGLLILKDLLQEDTLPPGAKLLTCGATSMYTNIQTEPAIEHILPYL
jgi:hypothetical protein